MASSSKRDIAWAKKYGRWALVTGASDGMGRAIAQELARTGINLILAARREDRLKSLAGELEKLHGIETMVLPLDFSKAASLDEVVRSCDGLDIGLLVAAAGYGTSGAFLEADLAAELDMLDVNCRAVFALTKVFADRFAAQGRGGIILFGSLVGFQGVPHAANYAATKAYVQTLAEGLRPELKRRGVDILAVAPGPVSTGFAARANMVMGGTDTPEAVAPQILRALGHRTTVKPGFFGKLFGYSLALMPRFARTMILGTIMSGMTSHQDAGKQKTN